MFQGRLRRRLVALGCGALFLGGAPALAAKIPEEDAELPPFAGPLAMRNDNPLYLPLFAPIMSERATVTRAGKLSWDVTYVNSNNAVEQDNFTRTDLVILDTEVQRTELDLRYGVTDRLEMALRVPYVAMGGGYMDHFIESAEEAFGFTVPGVRESGTANDFHYLVKVNGETLIDRTDPIDGLADIPVQVKYQFRDRPEGLLPRMAVRSVLKLPTATTSLLGNDRVDWGVGLLGEQPLGRRVLLWGNSDVTSAHGPPELKSLDIDPVMISGTAGMEILLTEKASVAVQATMATNPYPTFHDDLTVLNRVPIGVGLGWNYRLFKTTRIRLMAAENLAHPTWPDFSWSAAIQSEF